MFDPCGSSSAAHRRSAALARGDGGAGFGAVGMLALRDVQLVVAGGGGPCVDLRGGQVDSFGESACGHRGVSLSELIPLMPIAARYW